VGKVERVAVALPVIPQRTRPNGRGIPLVEWTVGGLPRRLLSGGRRCESGGAENDNLPNVKGLIQCW